MYKQKELIEEIEKKLAFISIVIEYSNKINLYDLNIYSESFFCNLLNLIYPYNLEDLNNRKTNFPAIDLADYERKICFQITSTNTKTRVKKVLSSFEKRSFYNKFSQLYIFFLKKKKDKKEYKGIESKDYFSTDNIMDFTDLIKQMKKLDKNQIIDIYQYIENNINKFHMLDCPQSLMDTIYRKFTKVNEIIIRLKKTAYMQYSIDSILINELLSKKDKLEMTSTILLKVAQFFNSIGTDDLFELSKYIYRANDGWYYYMADNIIKDFEFYEEYQVKDAFYTDYSLECCVRFLNNIKKILDLQINNTVSLSYGAQKEIMDTSLIVSISENEKKDNKLLVLDSNLDTLITPETCLGGIVEKVSNIKRVQNIILAQSDYNVYLWDIEVSLNVVSILISNEPDTVNDYYFYKNKDSFEIIVLYEKKLLIWRLINYIPFIYKTVLLSKTSDVLIKLNNKNILLKNSRYSREILIYNIFNETLNDFFILPECYNYILDLTIHPSKNLIAFINKRVEDINEYKSIEYDDVVQFNIDTNCESFSQTFKNKFLIDCEYRLLNNNIYLFVYDRDAAGSNLSGLIRAWVEKENNEFLYCDSTDFGKNYNDFYHFVKFFNNAKYLCKYSCINKLFKIVNNEETLFYTADKNYVINEIFT